MPSRFPEYVQLREGSRDAPHDLIFQRQFFTRGYDPGILLIYADWIEDDDPSGKSAALARDLRNSANGQTGWSGNFSVQGFGQDQSWKMNVYAAPNRYWLFTELPNSYGGCAHRVLPGKVSYRLALATGQWAVYRNDGEEERLMLVGNRGGETYHPWLGETFRAADYRPCTSAEVPDPVIQKAFWELLMKWRNKKTRTVAPMPPPASP